MMENSRATKPVVKRAAPDHVFAVSVEYLYCPTSVRRSIVRLVLASFAKINVSSVSTASIVVLSTNVA